MDRTSAIEKPGVEMFEYDGKHLLVDASCGNMEALVSPEAGKACLERIVQRINMTMILPPVSVKFPHAVGEMDRVLESLEKEGLGSSRTAGEIRQGLENRKQLYYGYSAFVMIAESHISLHTFPEGEFMTFDCYSCKNFDEELALACLDECFLLAEKKVQVIDRTIPFAKMRHRTAGEAGK
jgi:hypothetical protein